MIYEAVLMEALRLQAYNSATADKRTTSQKSWDKAQVRAQPLKQRLCHACRMVRMQAHIA